MTATDEVSQRAGPDDVILMRKWFGAGGPRRSCATPRGMSLTSVVPDCVGPVSGVSAASRLGPIAKQGGRRTVSVPGQHAPTPAKGAATDTVKLALALPLVA